MEILNDKDLIKKDIEEAVAYLKNNKIIIKEEG